MSKEENNLLAAIQNETLPPPSGDLEQIFQAHHARVMSAAFRLTGSAQDAEDVLQTVFLRLLRRQKTDLSPSPGSYLHRAAVNASLDLIRTRARARSLPLDELDAVLPESAHLDPDRRQQDRELRHRLRRAILALTDRSAEIFSLRFLEGLGNREIAGMLGMSQTAVGVALHRARKQVKKELSSLVGGQ